jgi:hypothetical protein
MIVPSVPKCDNDSVLNVIPQSSHSQYHHITTRPTGVPVPNFEEQGVVIIGPEIYIETFRQTDRHSLITQTPAK